MKALFNNIAIIYEIEKLAEKVFPMLKGANAYDTLAGPIKPGYGIRFSLETVGMLEDADDVLKIVPSFVWISEDGQTRKDVDVYYTETFKGAKHPLVKVGSSLDKSNTKVLSLGNDALGVEQDA